MSLIIPLIHLSTNVHPLPVHPLPIPTSTLGLKITNVGRLGRDYDGPFVSRVRASSRLSNLPVSDLVNYVDNPNQDGICILFESKNTSLRIAKKQAFTLEIDGLIRSYNFAFYPSVDEYETPTDTKPTHCFVSAFLSDAILRIIINV